MRRRLRSPIHALGLALLLASQGSAQTTGQVEGRVLDASTAEPVVAAQVQVEGKGRVLTDRDGRYVLTGLPAGVVDLRVSRLGYGAKTVTGVPVDGDRVTTLDITLDQRAVNVAGITASVERAQGSAAVLLDERRAAGSMVDAVGSVDISRRPDSDAAGVARRMTGVTVADGRYVFVRGLGDRYSQTSLDGSSLPSPEPEREVVPLDLFPAGFLESLQAQKSYSADLPADFAGGAVQIRTKDFPGRFTGRLGVSTSFNTSSQLESGFLRYTGGSRDWLGLDDGSRAQPGAVQDLMGSVRSGERLPSDPSQLVEIGRALRSIEQPFAPRSGEAPLDRSFDLSLGGRADVLEEGELGLFLAGTYSDRYRLRSDEIERKWRAEAFREETADLSTPNVDYLFTRGTRNVSWGTIGTLAFKPIPGQQVTLRTMVNLNTDDEARVYAGENSEDIGGEIRSERARFIERLMLRAQLSGEHAAALGSRVEWRLTTSRARRNEPLLRETIYLRDPISHEYRLLDSTESARYFFSELVDDDLGAELDWEVPVGFLREGASLKTGAAFRERTRDFGARRLNWRFMGGTIHDLDEALQSGTVVPGSPSAQGEFAIDEVVEGGDVYDASDRRAAGYLLFDLPLGDRVEAVVGARVERYELVLRSRDEDLNNTSETDIAPSLNVNAALGEDLSLRAAVSRTVDRPEFRELAPFQFTEATSLRQLKGNPDLTPARITSADLRLDFFPGPAELLSVGGFYKSLDSPIEQVFIAAASTAYSYQNAEKATLAGLELDARLGMGRLSSTLRDVTARANYSWITSDVSVRAGGIYQPTNLSRPLEGQAPYVFNAGLDYAGSGGIEAGVFFNRFGERLTAAGGSGLPDIYEQPRNALDATMAFPLPHGMRAKVKATNLLDAEYRFEQSANGIARTQQLHTVGRTFSVDVSWEF